MSNATSNSSPLIGSNHQMVGLSYAAVAATQNTQ